MMRYTSPTPIAKELLRFPVGVPIESTTVFVSSGPPPHLEPSPTLVLGEIGFAGPVIATGYWGLPELTAEKYIENPHVPGRVYRSGDLGRWRGDGCLEFLGRIDQQVKFNGVRIELG